MPVIGFIHITIMVPDIIHIHMYSYILISLVKIIIHIHIPVIGFIHINITVPDIIHIHMSLIGFIHVNVTVPDMHIH